jgi:DNA-binding NarL/FixJ family response regulator
MDSRKNQVQIGYSSRLFSNGLERIIDDFDHFSVVNCVPLGDKLKDSLDNNSSPDFLILEVDHPRERDLKYIRLLTESFGSVKILLLSHLPNRNMTSDLLESGILGYVLKSCSWQDLLSALTKMSEEKPYFCSDITKTLLPGNDSNYKSEVDSLTEREIKVLALLVQGLTNKNVAKDLKISENTVKTHRRNIQRKFGVSNLLGMVRYACREKLIDFGCMEYCTTCPYVN